MGYCIEIMQSQFGFTDEAKALAALQKLGNGSGDPRARGGSYEGGQRAKSWFSWMNDVNFDEMTTVDDAMAAWSYPVERDSSGDVVAVGFYGEKIGQEDLAFEVIAPFVKPGSFIEMLGEDGARWRWVFDGKRVTEQAATVTWG